MEQGYVKKSAVKQWLKTALQYTLLPLCYDIGLFGRSDRRRILFADSNSDTLPDSMRLVYEEMERRGFHCEVWCRDISRAGIVGTLSFFCRFMLRFAGARGLFICNFFLPANACRKRRATKTVQLWHSCGALKKFGYSTPSDISPHFKGSVSRGIDAVTVSSPACIPAFEEALRLDRGIARAVGVSRTDVFFDEAFKTACRRKLAELYPETRGRKLLLYLPTFRGDASRAQSRGHEAVIALKDRLGGEWYTAVRMHPRVKNGITELAELTTNELLICADMLITDYSSALFEYALTDRPMLLWCPDLEEYLAERDFYLDFRREMPCPIVTDPGELAERVRETYSSYRSGSFRAFTDKYMSSCDGKATERTAELFES